MNEEIFEKLIIAETPDDVQIIASEYDIDLNDADAKQLFSELEEIRSSVADGEIADEELDAVVGGFSFSSFRSKAKSFIKQHKDSIISAYMGSVSEWLNR